MKVRIDVINKDGSRTERNVEAKDARSLMNKIEDISDSLDPMVVSRIEIKDQTTNQ